MLHLHVAQQLPHSFKQSKFMHQWVISPTNDNDPELTISQFDIFLNKNVATITQVRNEGRQAWYTRFATYISR